MLPGNIYYTRKCILLSCYAPNYLFYERVSDHISGIFLKVIALL